MLPVSLDCCAEACRHSNLGKASRADTVGPAAWEAAGEPGAIMTSRRDRRGEPFPSTRAKAPAERSETQTARDFIEARRIGPVFLKHVTKTQCATSGRRTPIAGKIDGLFPAWCTARENSWARLHIDLSVASDTIAPELVMFPGNAFTRPYADWRCQQMACGCNVLSQPGVDAATTRMVADVHTGRWVTTGSAEWTRSS